MADVKTGSVYISAFSIDRNEISTVTHLFSVITISVKLTRIALNATGSGKNKIAATITEVVISQLADDLGTKFQLLSTRFRGQGIK